MRKHILHICLLLVLALLSCAREVDFVPAGEEEDGAPDGRVTVTFSVLTEHNPDTKALGEETNLNTDRMYLAVFGGSGYFKEYINATFVSQTREKHPFKVEDSQGNEVDVEKEVDAYTFQADLKLSNTPRTIHFLGNGPTTIRTGRDREVLPNLLGEYETAFWQMVTLPEITAKQIDGVYVKPDGMGGYTERTSTNDPYVISDETKAYFPETGIALVRNWSKIILRNSPTSHFTPISYAVVNVPKKGTLVPYGGRTGWIPDYQTKDFDDLFDADRPYAYGGNLPEGTEFDDTVPEIEDFINGTNGVVKYDVRFDELQEEYDAQLDSDLENAVYLYERPAPQGLIPPSYVIVYGTYYREDDTALTDEEKNAGGVKCFYKIDLMNNGVYYPIYRNFKYKIEIDKITARGHNNPKSAAASAGSADVSADVNAKHLQDISDGTRRMRVEPWLSKTFIAGEETQDALYVVFYDDVSGSDPKPNIEKESVTYQLLPADVGALTDIVLGDPILDQGGGNYGWRTLSFTLKDSDDGQNVSRTQTLRILCNKVGATESPLYRDIVITVQPRQEMRVACQDKRVLRQSGVKQVVDISIPDGLPQSMFPLVFTLEPQRLTLTPDNTKDVNMPVLSGKSLSGSGNPAFQFERTLSWTDYNALEVEYDFEEETRWRTFSSYFKTNCEESNTDILVANKYFLPSSASFDTYMTFTGGRFTTSIPREEGREVQAVASLLSSSQGFQRVYLDLQGLEPSDETIQWDSEAQAYYYNPSELKMTFNLKTTVSDGDVSITLKCDEQAYEPQTLCPWHFKDMKIMDEALPYSSSSGGITYHTGNGNNFSNVAYGHVTASSGRKLLVGYFTDPDSYDYTAEDKINLSVPAVSGVNMPNNWNNGGSLDPAALDHYRERWFETTTKGAADPVSVTIAAAGYVEETVTAPRFWGTLYNWELSTAANWNAFVANYQNSFSEEKTENSIKRKFTFSITASNGKTIRRHGASNGIILPSGGHYELRANLETANNDFYLYYAHIFYYVDGGTPLKPRDATVDAYPDGSLYYGYPGNNYEYCWSIPWGTDSGRLSMDAPYNQDIVITRIVLRGFHGTLEDAGGDIGFGNGGLNDGGGL